MNIQSVVNKSCTRNYPIWLDKFIDVYNKLSINNLSSLDELYHSDIIFIDPMHSLEGYFELTKYFTHLYNKLTDCRFTILQVIFEGNQAAIYWEMTYQHPQLNKAQPIKVAGSSQLQGTKDKVIFQRDYVDLGAMLYEHIPMVGNVIQYIKKKAVANV